jgi:uncharacterized membrane protein
MQQGSLVRLVMLVCWLGLVLVLSAPLLLRVLLGDNASVGFWLMQIVPLLLILPGILKLGSRTLQWTGFLVLFYFTQGVLQIFSAQPLQRWLGALTLLFCLVLFTAVIVTMRRGKQLQPPTDQSPTQQAQRE